MDSALLADAVTLSNSRHFRRPSSALPLAVMRSSPPPPSSVALRRGGVRCRSLSQQLSRSSSRINASLMTNGSAPSTNGIYRVGDFMTKKENLHVVMPTTTVDEALEMLVENRITGFPVIDDDWKLVGVVSDYDLLALDSISGNGQKDTSLFPEVDSTWKTFNQIQKLLTKINGKVIGDVMTAVPLVVRESSNLEDAARLLLETKYRRLPVVDDDGKLVGIITRGNVVRAALQIKRENEKRPNA